MVAPLGRYALTVLATPDLISYWRFDDAGGANGSTLSDYLAANDGVYTVAPTIDVPGLTQDGNSPAATFNGTTQHGVVTNVFLDQLAGVSIEAWVRPTGSFAALNQIAGIDVTNNTALLRIESGVFTTQFYVGPGITYLQAIDGNGVSNLDQIYHLVGTCDGIRARLYVNGQFTGQSSVTTQQPIDGNGPFRFGSFFGSSRFFQGTMDEVAAYGRALTAAEVLAHYTAGITPAGRIPTPTGSGGH